MAPERSPAFQFYPSDFLSDEHVVLMCHTERGVYITLLCMCWLHGSLPADLTELATLVSMPAQRFQKLWMNQLTKCFALNGDGRLHQKRLDKERDKQETHRQRQSDRGKAGADARWGDAPSIPPSMAQASPSNGASIPGGMAQASVSNGASIPLRHAQAMPSDGSSSSSSSSSSDFSQRDPSDLSRARGKPKALAIVTNPGFDAFWQVYPRKTGKDAARKAWERRHIGRELQLQILAALAWQKQQDAWIRDGGQFVPYPATWINQGRWEDEPSDTPTVSDRTVKQLAATREFLS